MIRRSGEDYADAFANLLPQGAAWPRDPDAALMQLVDGLAQIWGGVDGRAADLAEVETDPRLTYELLEEWERALGLPDPCVEVVQTLPERRRALVNKLTTEGGQSRTFFTGLATLLGYKIRIREYSPFQFGLSSFGGKRGQFQPPSVRFFWRVTVYQPRLTRWSFGGSSFGRDSFLEIRRAEDLECMLHRWKPAGTEIVFDYSNDPPQPVIERFEFGSSTYGNDPFLRIS